LVLNGRFELPSEFVPEPVRDPLLDVLATDVAQSPVAPDGAQFLVQSNLRVPPGWQIGNRGRRVRDISQRRQSLWQIGRH
jgi:hypothetical protein